MAEKKANILIMSPNLIGFEDGVNRIQPPLGIGYIAGRLRDKGHEVHIRDTALEGYNHTVPTEDGKTIIIGESEEETAGYIRNTRPDIVAISLLVSNMAARAKNLAKLAKGINPNIKTVLGGNHVNNNYERIIQDHNVDFAMRGECDFTLEELVSSVVNNRDISKVPGVVHMQDGKIFLGSKGDRIRDLDTLPKQARELMNMEGYFSIGNFHSSKTTTKRIGNVMAARGCPEKCTFCTTPQMWGSQVRWRNPQNIYEEIKELKDRYKVEEIQFEDDTLTSNRVKLLELCDLIEPLNLRWCTPNGIKINYHANNPEKQAHLFRRMHESGCYQVTLALESGSQEVLDEIINKRLPLGTVKPTAKAAKEAGLFVHVCLMTGFPGETAEQRQQTIRFAEYLEADSYSLAIVAPLPGTPLFEKARRENLLIDGFNEDKILYRNSLIKVPEYSPSEFECWVDEQNIRLNKILKERDPERFREKYGTTDERVLKKQT